LVTEAALADEGFNGTFLPRTPIHTHPPVPHGLGPRGILLIGDLRDHLILNVTGVWDTVFSWTGNAGRSKKKKWKRNNTKKIDAIWNTENGRH